MTPQAALNKVHKWFVVQGKPRSARSNGCVYRGLNGARCAAGVCMPDEVYSPKYEGCSVDTLPSKAQKRLGPPETIAVLASMQSLHDEWDSTGDFRLHMRDGLRRIAREHGLREPT